MASIARIFTLSSFPFQTISLFTLHSFILSLVTSIYILFGLSRFPSTLISTLTFSSLFLLSTYMNRLNLFSLIFPTLFVTPKVSNSSLILYNPDTSRIHLKFLVSAIFISIFSFLFHFLNSISQVIADLPNNFYIIFFAFLTAPFYRSILLFLVTLNSFGHTHIPTSCIL